MNIVLPAILEHDTQSIQQRVDAVVGIASEIHLDVMDGEFVPNKTLADPTQLAGIDWKGLKVSLHLMIKNPELYIRKWAFDEVSSMVVHREAINNMDNVIDLVHSQGKQFGVAINPHTPSYDITDYLDKIDVVLVMGVEPGFSAQGFNADVLDKIRFLRKQKSNLLIAVDGGVNLQTKGDIVAAGATILCANSYLFKAPNLVEAYQRLGE